jgi:hypothetical protein
VSAGTVRGPRENWVEMQAVASLRGQRVYGQCRSMKRWLFELEPEAEELLGAAAAFGVGGGCQRFGILVP